MERRLAVVKVKLVEDWKKIALKAWSFRIAILLALIQAIEAGAQYYLSGQTPIMSVIGTFIALGGALSRVVAQKNLD
jgi:hypothetical protein